MPWSYAGISFNRGVFGFGAMSKCKHPEDEVKARWNYSGSKLISASGFCEECSQEFVYSDKEKKLVPGSHALYRAKLNLKAAIAEYRKAMARHG